MEDIYCALMGRLPAMLVAILPITDDLSHNTGVVWPVFRSCPQSTLHVY